MLLETINNFQIVLASQSSRRQELLSNMGLQFTTHQSNVDETVPKDVPLENVAQYLARRKAEDVAQHYPQNAVIIGGDTTVLLEDRLLEKPQNRDEALSALKQLSGKTHRVISAVSMVHHSKTRSCSDTTRVSFNPLREEEINFYIDKYKPFDKAGSYGIQEWIGCIGIARIEGSFYTVMGLPTHLLWDMFKQIIL